MPAFRKSVSRSGCVWRRASWQSLSYVLTNEQFLAWGWRVAFVLSFVLVLIGLYIRLNIMETPECCRDSRRANEE